MEANFLTAVFLLLALFIYHVRYGVNLDPRGLQASCNLSESAGDWLGGAVGRVADCGLWHCVGVSH
ncbi:MAG: hypothetical protein V7L09_09930 [Nostoc sp.]|uniref:hypothetical protein n=1 Tax=Nostoc sp. TaxID=1180 RepID=UPI002FFA6C33